MISALVVLLILIVYGASSFNGPLLETLSHAENVPVSQSIIPATPNLFDVLVQNDTILKTLRDAGVLTNGQPLKSQEELPMRDSLIVSVDLDQLNFAQTKQSDLTDHPNDVETQSPPVELSLSIDLDKFNSLVQQQPSILDDLRMFVQSDDQTQPNAITQQFSRDRRGITASSDNSTNQHRTEAAEEHTPSQSISIEESEQLNHTQSGHRNGGEDEKELNTTEVTQPEHSSDETPQTKMEIALEDLDAVQEICTDILQETEIILKELENLKEIEPADIYVNRCNITLN